MATTLLETHKGNITLLELEPSGGGVFEVSVDGESIHSKRETGEFPEEAAMLAEVERRLG